MERVCAEVESVLKCTQCHINAEIDRWNWFTMVCDVPHLIVWAHKRNSRYWPAKVMSVNELKGMVNVRFFGGFQKHENVPISKCFLYSKSGPGKKQRLNDPEFKFALEVIGVEEFL